MDWREYGVSFGGGQYSVNKPSNMAWLILLVFGRRKRLVHVNHVPQEWEVMRLFEKYGDENHCNLWNYFISKKDENHPLHFNQYDLDKMIDEMFNDLKKICWRDIV